MGPDSVRSAGPAQTGAASLTHLLPYGEVFPARRTALAWGAKLGWRDLVHDAAVLDEEAAGSGHAQDGEALALGGLGEAPVERDHLEGVRVTLGGHLPLRGQ
jgi:hypothetical protein